MFFPSPENRPYKYMRAVYIREYAAEGGDFLPKDTIERVIPGRRLIFTNLDEAIRYARSIEKRDSDEPAADRTGSELDARLVTLNGKDGEHITLSVGQLKNALEQVKQQTADKSEICFTGLSGDMEVTAVQDPAQDKKGVPSGKVQDRGKGMKTPLTKATIMKVRARAIRRPSKQPAKSQKVVGRTHLRVGMTGRADRSSRGGHVKAAKDSGGIGLVADKGKTVQDASVEVKTKKAPTVYMSGQEKTVSAVETRHKAFAQQPQRTPQAKQTVPDGQSTKRRVAGPRMGTETLKKGPAPELKNQKERGAEAPGKSAPAIAATNTVIPAKKENSVKVPDLLAAKDKTPKPYTRKNLDELEVMGKRMVQARRIMIAAATITLSSGRMTSFTDKQGRRLTFRREMEENTHTGNKAPIVRGYIDGKAVQARAFEEGKEVDDRKATKFLSSMLEDMSRESVRELQAAIEAAEKNPSIRREDLRLEMEEKKKQEEKEGVKDK